MVLKKVLWSNKWSLIFKVKTTTINVNSFVKKDEQIDIDGYRHHNYLNLKLDILGPS